jgi:glycosyltransferase involved in cell wall biosynthesis
MKRDWIEYLVIQKSGLFDSRYYLREYKDIRVADIDPLMHYIKDGWREGRNPSSLFNTKYYLEKNPDVKASGTNPLFHYVRYGKAQGLSINPTRVNTLSLPIDWRDYVPKISTIVPRHLPKVSVIVPNYNHGMYLEERLTSIYAQSYKNFEVILLDDCSTDNSVKVLKSFYENYSSITRCNFNTTNSGSPFSQWEKGIHLSEGELIWIAESDDYCENDFLEKMVYNFSDDSVLCSYAHPVLVDRNGRRLSFSFESYVGQIHPLKWNSSYIETAHREVNDALGLLNTIPNVSGVVFRKPDEHFELFHDADWKQMKVCGDWLFYLHLVRGGRIAYCNDTHNYYRIHQGSTSKATHSQDIYYQEHLHVACSIARLYKIPVDLLVKFQKRLKDFYFENVKEGSSEKFEKLFDLNKVYQCMAERHPNVLLAIYGFAFGGGEIFPIRLANELKRSGASVTILNGGFEPTQPNVRKMLSPQIAVINNSSTIDLDQILEDFGVEIIHSHHASMEDFISGRRTLGKPGAKHVATMHGMYEMMSDVHFLRKFKKIRKSVNHWVYTAEKNILPFKKHGVFSADNFSKIDNGIQVPNARPLDLSSLGITADSFTACLASRALPEKGWIEAIEATKKVREITNKDVHLLLIGEGKMYDILRTEEIPEFIHLLGFRGNLADYLASVQLGLLPSYFKGESFPLVLIEYFMAEIPVIASSIGEISSMITTDDHQIGGSLIELRNGKVDPDDLADAMIRLVTDENFYYNCVAAVRLLKTRFDIDNVAQQYLSVYKHTLG